MTDFSHRRRDARTQIAAEDWAIAIATALLTLILLGLVPRIHG